MLYIVGICVSALYSSEDLDSIVLRQKSALSNAYNRSKNGDSIDSAVAEYRNTLKQIVVDLYSLGYPVLSFYVDHHLSHIIRSQDHISLVDTVSRLRYISKNFAHSCLQNGTHRKNTYLCGVAHLPNADSKPWVLPSQPEQVYRIKVPPVFYIKLQFLEIVLGGVVRQNDCLLYQSFTVWSTTDFPFVPDPPNAVLSFVFCGSHTLFTTILPGNVAVLKGTYYISNTYASCKIKYTAIDIQVRD